MFACCGVELQAGIGRPSYRLSAARTAVVARPAVVGVVAGEGDAYRCAFGVGGGARIAYRAAIDGGGHRCARAALASAGLVVGGDIVGGGRTQRRCGEGSTGIGG